MADNKIRNMISKINHVGIRYDESEKFKVFMNWACIILFLSNIAIIYSIYFFMNDNLSEIKNLIILNFPIFSARMEVLDAINSEYSLKQVACIVAVIPCTFLSIIVPSVGYLIFVENKNNINSIFIFSMFFHFIILYLTFYAFNISVREDLSIEGNARKLIYGDIGIIFNSILYYLSGGVIFSYLGGLVKLIYVWSAKNAK